MLPRDLFGVAVRFLGLAMLAGGASAALMPFIGILGVPCVGLLLVLFGQVFANGLYPSAGAPGYPESRAHVLED
jgi:hypothetical protein